jgi:hypothetical protein
MNVFTLVDIMPHHSGFGMWQRGEVQVSPDNSWAYFGDLLNEVKQNSYLCKSIEEALTDEEFIAKGIIDIRGKIYNQPDNIHAVIDDYGALSYFGIAETIVSDKFYL